MLHKKLVLFAMVFSGAALMYASDSNDENNAYIQRLIDLNRKKEQELKAHISRTEYCQKHHPMLFKESKEPLNEDVRVKHSNFVQSIENRLKAEKEELAQVQISIADFSAHLIQEELEAFANL